MIYLYLYRNSIFLLIYLQKTQKQKVTGYIMYASEVRKTVSAGNPDSSFGEISRLVGLDVRIVFKVLCIYQIVCMLKFSMWIYAFLFTL